MHPEERLDVKFIVDNWTLIAVALASGGMLLWPVLAQGGRMGQLSAAGAVQFMNRDKAVVVDINEPAEFAAGHVVGSRNIPLTQLEQQLPASVKNKASPLLIVCATGTRSSRALAVAKKLGYENAQVLGGGLTAWKAASLPLEKA